MKLFLNNLIKGLATALVVICLGGFISLNINVPPSNVMVLVSSSLVNSINTDIKNSNIGDGEVLDDLEEIVDKEEFDEEKLEIKEESTENTKEESNDSNTNQQSEVNTNQETNRDENNQTSSESTETPEEIVIQGEYAPNLEVASSIEPIATYYGKMTGYGPDCVGCSGITASGMNVMNGNIYYEDKTFGTVRIVAGDRSIPFGSIIKITGINISSEPVLAIVLDRGGMIGFAEGKHSYFDLLYKSEQDALSFGRQDATFELLRSGY